MRRGAGEHELLEALLGGAVVGGDARGGHGDLAAVAEHHVHALGADPVEALDLLGVAAQLEHRVDLGPTRQLGVLGLVDVAALGVGLRLAHDEVGVAAPPERRVGLVEEGGLVEHVVAAGHGLGGGGRGGAEALDRGGGGVEVDHREPLGGEGVAVGVLVLEAQAPEQVEALVGLVGPDELAAEHPVVEDGGVLAREVGDEVGGADDDGSIAAVHLGSSPVGRAGWGGWVGRGRAGAQAPSGMTVAVPTLA